ncbi:CHAT domain-containing protein [bacterium]|nr:CHAT domain-containing protein [bacterium]
MKRVAVVLSLSVAVWAQLPDNELLRAGQPETVLAGQPSTLDWAEAMVELNPHYLNSQRVLQQLEGLPDSPEVLLMRGRLHWRTPEGAQELRRAYQLASGVTRLRAAAALAMSEAKAGRKNEAMQLLSEALHGAQKVDQSWLDFEVALASSQVHSCNTPDQPEWGSLLQVRQRCRQRQDWFWAARAGMAIFEQLRLLPDQDRTLEYALGALDDAEKSGCRLYLWSAVQQFATGFGGVASKEKLAPLLADRAQSSSQPFAYLSGMHWFRWQDPESWSAPVSAAQTDWEGYISRRDRIQFQPQKDDLLAVHEYEVAHQNDRTFTAFGSHLQESDYYKRLADLESAPEVRATLLWDALRAAAHLQPFQRYNLLLDITRKFERDGRLVDLLRAKLLQYQHILSQPSPVYSAAGLYRSGLTGAAALSSDWSSFWADSARMELASQLDSFESDRFQKLDKPLGLLDRASELRHLGDLYAFQNRTLESLEASRSEVEARPEQAFRHRDLAVALIEVGQDEEAVRELQTALDLDAQGNGYGEEVLYLSWQAGCQVRLGNLKAAEEALAQAEVKASEHKYGQETIDGQRSKLLRAQKRWKDLENLYQRRIARALPLERFRLLLGLGELQMEQHQDLSAKLTFKAADQLADELDGGASARLWLAWPEHLDPESRRQLLQKAQSRLQQLAGLLPEKDRSRFQSQPAVAAVLSGQPFREDKPAPALPTFNKQDFLTATAVLRQRFPEWEQLSPVAVPTLLEVQPRLSAREIFLCFSALPHQVVIMGCDRNKFYLHRGFFERSSLESQIQQLQRGLSRPGGSYKASSRRLYDNLLAPLQAATEDRQVWLACQGQLLNLPWPALQDQQGKFVVEHWASHRLWWGLSPKPRMQLGVEPALLVAAPGKNHLEGVVPEVRDILRLLPGSRSLIGNQATRANLSRWLPAYRWLLAAHSSLDRNALQNSYVELEDGPLPLNQLYALKLQPQTTVVLSSCQTAQGQAQPGKDVLSLGSGFRVSGAGQVLATLWPVDDEASVEFFSRLYPRLRNQTPLAGALYATAREFLKSNKRKHPFFWAAYQLEGDMFR